MDMDIIISMIMIICIHCVGMYLHIKIIKISRKEKQMTWKLDITNSCMLMAHHTHCVFMDGISYIVQDLYKYTGEWFCYTSKAVMYYGNLYTVTHSMIVSMLKYIIIIHWKKARNMGHEKIQKIFFWINLLYPGIQILLHLILIPDFFVAYDLLNGQARINRCLGDPNNVMGTTSNGTQMLMDNINYCQHIHEPSHEYYFAYALHVLKSIICWVQVIALFMISWNFVEMLIYCKIFSFMRR